MSLAEPEVLRQIVDEEWLLFCDSHHDPQNLVQLRREHQELRRLIEVLDNAAASTGEQSPNHLAVTTRDLLTKLGTHMGAQEQVLGTDAEPPSTSALGSSPHTWYEFTNGPLVDLDNLPGPQGVDAALSRMLDFAPANRWTCKPAAIRSPSGGDCRWLTRAVRLLLPTGRPTPVAGPDHPTPRHLTAPDTAPQLGLVGCALRGTRGPRNSTAV